MPTDPVPVPTGRPIVFYTPHQDDETLFMGRVIAHHCLAAREVHVVLCTDGSTSNVLDVLNGIDSSSWWGGYHYPAREGYDLLTGADLAAARDKEFISACHQLGVQVGNVHLLPGRTSAITVDEAKAVIGQYDDLYPDAGHYTMWWGDQDSNHAALGEALRQLRNADPVKYNDVRWMTRPADVVAAGASQYAVPAALDTTVDALTCRAAWCYRAWLPRAGAYAVGYHSVGLSYFDDVERGDPDWIVRPG